MAEGNEDVERTVRLSIREKKRRKESIWGLGRKESVVLGEQNTAKTRVEVRSKRDKRGTAERKVGGIA